MKLKLLLAFIAASIVACSSDDGTAVNPTGTDLNEVKTYRDGELVEVNKYENNKLKERYLYENGQVFLEDLNTYDNQGRLIERVVNFSNINNISNTSESTQSIEYDNAGRIISITEEAIYDGLPAPVKYRTFNYNIPNKITETISSEGQNDYQYVYDLNSSGYVNKITLSGPNPSFRESVFEGDNIITYTTSDYNFDEDNYTITTTSYTYDMDTPVMGSPDNRFGSNKANTALFYANTSSHSVNYLIEVVTGDNVIQKQYEFNSGGYPTKIKTFQNNSLLSESHITYQ
jgi:hypothetical protein